MKKLFAPCKYILPATYKLERNVKDKHASTSSAAYSAPEILVLKKYAPYNSVRPNVKDIWNGRKFYEEACIF